MSELVEVRLLELPLDLSARADERHAELLRELALIAVSDDETAARIPRRVLDLVQRIDETYSAYSDAAKQRILSARESGHGTLDLVFELPAESIAATRLLLQVLEEADEFCREGDLLTLAADDALVRYRRWALTQCIDQIEGGEPIPWPAYVDRVEAGASG